MLSPFLAIGSLFYVVKTFRQQSFENTFNLLLEQHNSLADKISNEIDGKPSIIQKTLQSLGEDWLDSRRSWKAVEINEDYEINRYVRVVYQVLKFIDENCPNEKSKFSRIFRSFLSNDLLYLVGLNSVQCDNDESLVFPGYKALIEKFGLLEHLFFDFKKAKLQVDYSFKKPDIFLLAYRYKLAAFGDKCNITKATNALYDGYLRSLQTALNETESCLNRINSLKDVKQNQSNLFLRLLKQHLKESLPPSAELIAINEKLGELLSSYIALTGDEPVPDQCVDIGKEMVSKIEEELTSEVNSSKKKKGKFNPHVEFLEWLKASENFPVLLGEIKMREIEATLDRIKEIEASSDESIRTAEIALSPNAEG